MVALLPFVAFFGNAALPQSFNSGACFLFPASSSRPTDSFRFTGWSSAESRSGPICFPVPGSWIKVSRRLRKRNKSSLAPLTTTSPSDSEESAIFSAGEPPDTEFSRENRPRLADDNRQSLPHSCRSQTADSPTILHYDWISYNARIFMGMFTSLRAPIPVLAIVPQPSVTIVCPWSWPKRSTASISHNSVLGLGQNGRPRRRKQRGQSATAAQPQSG
ncbi:hypothetical protein BDK51DRAFT_44343 [Blyttiomyces helicus]|uniref:Uncharacterized protein n=1 Tax=Blyttiomyces helicus TaxID=388810 RepID=A0A4P9WM34_9FUNG|nr:hypothetical protein BDK51DRAFT_44343 [Blyttiomyces helicus]|eukprot:RKO92220.1 hypothetical protein BDK51DRAFT_44343 [Blyttiomyces helicus]